MAHPVVAKSREIPERHLKRNTNTRRHRLQGPDRQLDVGIGEILRVVSAIPAQLINDEIEQPYGRGLIGDTIERTRTQRLDQVVIQFWQDETAVEIEPGSSIARKKSAALTVTPSTSSALPVTH